MRPNTREEEVLPLVRGKRALDCGDVDHCAHLQKQAAGNQRHALIAATAAETIGVDVVPDKVDAINSAGQCRFLNLRDLGVGCAEGGYA